MTEKLSSLNVLVAKRTEFVLELGKQNAEHVRLCQMAGAAEINVMRHERDAEAQGEPDGFDDELNEAFAQDRDAKAALMACERRLQVLEESIAELDREIADAVDS